MNKRLLKEQGGFTLVELLIVIAILGILAALAAPRFMDMRQQAQVRGCQANQAAIDSALEVYRYNNPTATTAPGISFLVGDGMLKTIPVCPTSATNTYTFTFTALTTCNNSTISHNRTTSS